MIDLKKYDIFNVGVILALIFAAGLAVGYYAPNSEPLIEDVIINDTNLVEEVRVDVPLNITQSQFNNSMAEYYNLGTRDAVFYVVGEIVNKGNISLNIPFTDGNTTINQTVILGLVE